MSKLSPLETAQRHCAAAYEKLTTPKSITGGLRSVMVSHIQSLVTEHNAVMQARIDFIQTGAVAEVLRDTLPYIASMKSASAREKERAITNLEQCKMLMPAWDGLDDAALVSAYSQALLRLRDADM